MKNRLSLLQQKLEEKHLDGFLVSSVPSIIYLTGYNGFSIEEREAFLLITQKDAYIFTDARYIDAVQNIPGFTLQQIGGDKPFRKVFGRLVTQHTLKAIGFEPHNLNVAEYIAFKKVATFKAVEYLIEDIREIKSAEEIAAITKACALGDAAFAYALPHIKEGQTEKEVAYFLEDYMRQNGAAPSFRTIAAFGKNAAIPHHMTGEDRLTGKKGQYILMDFGVKIDNYCSDMTRTVFFGTPSEDQVRIYTTVKDAQQKAITYLAKHSKRAKGVEAQEVDSAARKHISSQGYPSIPHSVGHGIGIEVHEYPSISPNSDDLLQEGMVFSVEPGIYFSGVGGVRIEDLVTLENADLRILTNAPKELIVL